jgi:hypothetical protein
VKSRGNRARSSSYKCRADCEVRAELQRVDHSYPSSSRHRRRGRWGSLARSGVRELRLLLLLGCQATSGCRSCDKGETRCVITTHASARATG